MSSSALETVEDAARELRDLQNSLEGRGELVGALRLCKALSAFYTTSSEALIGMIEALTDGEIASDYTQAEAHRAQWLVMEMKRLLNLR